MIQTNPPVPPRFASLAGMREQHAELLRSLPPEGLTEEQGAEVTGFLERGAATGAVLDVPPDRMAAQGLLDYWKATLYTQARSAAKATGTEGDSPTRTRLLRAVLADFDEPAVNEVAGAADAAVQAMSHEEQEAARRVLLGLVRMAPEGTEFTAVPAPRAELEPLGSTDQVNRVLDALTGAGALRLESGPARGNDRLGLAYDALTRVWGRLKGWLEQRLLFRDAARFWDRHARDPAALFVGMLLEEAKSYHDLNPLEQEFVAACHEEAERQAREKEAAHRRDLEVANRRTEIRNRLLVLAGVALAIMVVLAVVAMRQSQIAKAERGNALEAGEKEKEQRQKAEAQSQIAETQRQKAVAERDALALTLPGIESERNGNYKLAISFYTKAIKRDETFAFPHLLLGAVYHMQGKYEDAIGEYSQAIELNDQFADAHTSLGDVYATLGRLDDAVSEYTLAIALDPASAHAHYSLGYTYLQQHKLEKAVNELKTAVSLTDPQDYNAFFNLGLAFALQGHADKARDQWKEGLSRCQGVDPIAKLNRVLYTFVLGETGTAEVQKFLDEAELPRGLLREALLDAELLAECPDSTKPKGIETVIEMLKKAIAEASNAKENGGGK